MKSTKKETWKIVILSPVISGHGHFQLFSLYITFFSYLCNKFRKNELLYNKQTVKQGHK